MRLHDIESAVLLPRFAHNAEWEQKALDQVVKGVRAKSFAMGAPYTRKAIAALSDAELQAFYFQYGIAIYYPDLSRETRENMLFELARVYRSLGTPHSVELLCEYIFDGADKVRVEIHDNLAFNAAGELVDDSLLDLFDVDLFPTFPTLSQDKIERIVENIFRFCRNSQTLRDIIIEFPDVAELPIASCDLEAFVYTIGGDEIAEEPQPVETLPTVTTEGDFASYNWLRVSSAESVSGGGNTSNLTTDGTDSPNYNTGNSYAILQWQQSGGTTSGRVEFSIVNANEKIQAHNNTSGALTFYQARVAVCSSNQATVVTVYNSSNVAYNAFKFTANNTDYYYVLDGAQTDWTDDLAGIGYSLTPAPVLPEVILMAYNGNEWNYPASFNTNPLRFVSGEQAQLYIASGTSFSYESGKVYSVGEYQNPSGTTTGRYGFSVVSVNSKIGCKNISGGSITIQRMSVYRCSDSAATVVTVYDRSLVPYNAFKYTAGGTDYYYVLDGTQTDWTDDLSSIGYQLTSVCYRKADKTPGDVSAGSGFYAYDDNGQKIVYDVSKTYTIIKIYSSASDTSGTNPPTGLNLEKNSSDDFMLIYNRGSSSITVQRVEYTVS